MLTIALTKALLVILFFMHVRWSTRLTWVVVASGFFWLLILFGITMSRLPHPRMDCRVAQIESICPTAAN